MGEEVIPNEQESVSGGSVDRRHIAANPREKRTLWHRASRLAPRLTLAMTTTQDFRRLRGMSIAGLPRS